MRAHAREAGGGACRKQESVKLPSSLKSIGDEAFFFCLKLSLIKIPSSVTSIGRMAF
ncbi:MAG: leucine-rich repeat protein, partial [Bacteroidales bacterium]|nr:leucine-rich repeat protein [Bacteroidales bacterium]